MRRGLFGGTAAAVFVAAIAFMVAPGAFAASPQDICNDLKDGKVDGSYTLAEWQAFFRDPTVQGYCTPTSVVIPPPVTPTPPPETGTTTTTSTAPPPVPLSPAPQPASAPRTSGVKGAQHTATSKPSTSAPKSAPAPATLGATRTKGALPFTGADLTVFAVVGLALIAIGIALRSTTKRRPQSPRT